MSDICPFDVTPLAIAKIVNTPPIYNLNYTSQDYSSMRNRLLELIQANFGKEFNDFNESSMAVMLVECWSWLADLLSFKIDQVANELFIDTVTETENAFRLAKLVGFKPQPPIPAKAMFTATINGVFSTDVSLKTPLIAILEYGAKEIRYELFAADANNNPVFGVPVVIPAGSRFNSAIVGLEGFSNFDKYKSNGNANQTHILPYTGVCYGSTSVEVGGQPWEEVEYFTESQPLPQYILEYNADYKMKVIFGNGKAGMVPPQGSDILIKYRTASYTTSEIITGAIESKTYTQVPGIPHQVIITLKNYTKSEYGYPGDNINDIRRKLPEFLRTQDRAVTGPDYQSIASRFMSSHNGGIGKSTAVLRNHGCAGNVIDIIVLAQTGKGRLLPANDNLKAELIEFMNKKKMVTDHICIKDGHVVAVDITIDIFLEKSYKKMEASIKQKVSELLGWYFNLNNWDFGKPLRTSEIIKVVSDIKEIKHLEVSFTTVKSIEEEEGSHDTVYVNYKEIVRPDNINLNFTYKLPGEM